MINQPKKQNKQQGYILAFALIVMIFIGAVFISSTDHSGTEQRLAISELHAASLEAALYAGMYKIEYISSSEGGENKNDSLKMCTNIKDKFFNQLLGVTQDFQSTENQGAAIYWKLKKITPKCSESKPEIGFELMAWQGDELSPISRLVGRGKISIRLITNSDLNNTGILGGLNAALKDKAVTSSGEVTLEGSGKVIGNAAGNKINIKGGGSSIVGSLAYQEIELPDYMKNKDWYIEAEKNLLDEAIKADPLGLEKTMNESFYTDQNGNKTLLKNISKIKISEELNKLPKGKTAELGQWPFQKASLTPSKLEVYNSDWEIENYQKVNVPVYYPVSFLGEDINLMALKDFKINSGGPSPSLTVSGGKVVLFIDGDVNFSGGTSIKIADDSSLTLIVTGKVNIGSGFDFPNKKPINNQGEPSFTLLSNNKTDKKSVIISGDTKFYGMIYALSDVNVTGSGGVEGQVFGANILVQGSSFIDFSSSGSSSDSSYSPELDSNFQIDY